MRSVKFKVGQTVCWKSFSLMQGRVVEVIPGRIFQTRYKICYWFSSGGAVTIKQNRLTALKTETKMEL